jgi:phage/plasmid-associated DNA primase
MMMTSNSEPQIKQRDLGWERRMRVIPFDYVPRYRRRASRPL